MLKKKHTLLTVPLSIALVGFGAPLQACSFHGGGFGMQRFNPFQQAQAAAPSSSWNDSLNQSRASSQTPQTRASDEPSADDESAEETWDDQQNSNDEGTVSGPAQIGRSDDQIDFEQDSGQDYSQQELMSLTANDSEADRAMFH
ncbi:MAG: hypothetical protein ABJN65_00845 [Parasphingorhabdus sp.]